ncbi:retron Ec67 family RNA-directed DNA polymerase/endonuclease [Brucella pseudogrignonensis]|uniref:retron Ec67 family RNA-directed DNA polymerase/endonuclease n=1 Tax=Brucella pseudogrignonensis TaxID=419475 RepID=UPI0028B2E27F|nr:retron Ec67 family RNA-directed DNA polymerase/endonuclease [Brucella pseudogrignonensis]MDT6939821.1 retron Ec67 family RNA-directed DNA polymerase/endonuclease [Brucella pseudogrignonensis]
MLPIITQSPSILRNVKTLGQLAALLKEQPKVLSYWLYKAPLKSKYVTYTIPKKNGGYRTITAPQDGLKRIQVKLARLLSEIYNDLEQKRIDESFDGVNISKCVLAHGFKDKYSIVTNSRLHIGKKFVFNTDLENFFPSITFGRVRGFFISDNNFRLDPSIATIIAQVSCYNNTLPQGAPCSPVISNFIAHMLDIKLNKMAKAGNCSYTRYADDLTFSTNEQNFPAAIARLVAGTNDRWVAGSGLLSRVYASGFRINHDKSRMQLPHSRQEATGLTINQNINVPNEYYKNIRSQCHNLFKEGYCFEIVKGKWTEVSSRKLQGRMDFIHYVRRSRFGVSLDHVAKKDLPIAYRAREQKFIDNQVAFGRIYKQLLNYRSFHGMEKPIIIGEGTTDAIYINAAIKTIGAAYSKLYNTLEDELLVDFYKHTEKRKFYQIGEGAPPLKDFIRSYKDLVAPFAQKPSHPVVILVDNDKDGREVINAACNRWNKTANKNDPFIHLIGNLYITMVPLPAAKTDASIEDLFDQQWLYQENINGKHFSKDNNYNTATHFGKVDLAGKIVRPKRTSIDWSGFLPLLNNIQDAIVHFDNHNP